MPALWSPEDLAARFAPYIAELHDVFTMHGLSFGSPDDICLLTERLATPGPLNEELAALVRSMVLREGGSIPRTDLLEIVAIAIAGPRMDPAGEELQQPVRQLLTFLHSALRRPWNEPPGEERFAPSHDDDLRAEAARELREAAAKIEAEAAAAQVAAQQQRQTGPGPDTASASHPPPANIIPFGRARAVFSRLARGEEDEWSEEAESAIPSAIHSIPQLWAHPPAAAANTGPAPATDAVAVAAAPPPVQALPPEMAFAPKLPSAMAAAPSFDEEPPLPSPPHFSRAALLYSVAAIVLLAIGLGIGLSMRATANVGAHASSRTAASAQRGAAGSAASAIPPLATASAAKPTPLIELPAARRIPRSDDGYVAAPYSSSQESAPTANSAMASPSGGAAAAVGATADSGYPPQMDASLRRDPDAGIVAGGELAHTTAIALSGPPLHPHIAGGVMAENILSAPKPDYPMLAKMAHVDGPVVLHAEITRGGAVADTRVISGHHLLRHAAEDAVRHWRFRPYQVDGKPVPVSTTITVRFHH